MDKVGKGWTRLDKDMLMHVVIKALYFWYDNYENDELNLSLLNLSFSKKSYQKDRVRHLCHLCAVAHLGTLHFLGLLQLLILVYIRT